MKINDLREVTQLAKRRLELQSAMFGAGPCVRVWLREQSEGRNDEPMGDPAGRWRRAVMLAIHDEIAEIEAALLALGVQAVEPS